MQYNILKLDDRSSISMGNYEVYNSDKNGLVGSDIHMVENTL